MLVVERIVPVIAVATEPREPSFFESPFASFANDMRRMEREMSFMDDSMSRMQSSLLNESPKKSNLAHSENERTF